MTDGKEKVAKKIIEEINEEKKADKIQGNWGDISEEYK